MQVKILLLLNFVGDNLLSSFASSLGFYFSNWDIMVVLCIILLLVKVGWSVWVLLLCRVLFGRGVINDIMQVLGCLVMLVDRV